MVAVNSEEVLSYVNDRWDEAIIPELIEYIRIPNKSPAFDPDWEQHGHMQEAVELLTRFVAASPVVGMSYEVVTLSGRTPTLFCEIEASEGNNAAPVFMYGHYDKQPEFEGWEEDLGPWEPVMRDGKLYGRGGADDGYALYASLTAIEALQRQGVAHPRIVILIEGCEESGSFDLPFYVEALKDRIGIPQLVVCLDAGCGNYDQLWLTTSLRGMLPGTLRVEVLEQGQHSGVAGGIVPSSFRLLRHLLDRVEDSATGQMLDDLQVTIPYSAVKAAEQVAQILGPAVKDQFPWSDGVQPDGNTVEDMILNNCWRPSLATVGFGGAPDLANAGNTLRTETATKLVVRLPPTLEAEPAAEKFKALLETDPPNNAKVTFELDTPQTGWCAPETAPWLEAALQDASSTYYGKPPAFMGMGGTIPFMKMLGDAYPTTQFMVAGVLGPLSNAHGPNEFLHIEMGKRLTACVANVLAHAATTG